MSTMTLRAPAITGPAAEAFFVLWTFCAVPMLLALALTGVPWAPLLAVAAAPAVVLWRRAFSRPAADRRDAR